MLTKEQKSAIIAKYGKNPKDTGSDAVQIALLTERIKELTAHLKANKKDASARRGLMILVGQRRSLLKHLSSVSQEEYLELIAKLGIRK